ncbi:hypothetical protein Y1Q_0022034 [Alligator mississippiensis]|uniref:Uncharacterized protein n=1 Tax=Alligator mississippiensis TaxID=8496 RepID=A0A151NLT3_ALLMI|nr:hypothetical protein Y1Q_0022034 [Alligator mississippiensis]
MTGNKGSRTQGNPWQGPATAGPTRPRPCHPEALSGASGLGPCDCTNTGTSALLGGIGSWLDPRLGILNGVYPVAT